MARPNQLAMLAYGDEQSYSPQVIPYQGGCGCKHFDEKEGKCSLTERPLHADYVDVPTPIVEANNTFVEASGVQLMGASIWPSCDYALTYCIKWSENYHMIPH